MESIDEVVAEFLVESHENLDQLDRDLLALEARPGDRAVLSSIFRTIHTIKGTCGFLGFNRLEALTHVGESLLSRMRDGSLTLDETTANALLAMVDAVRRMLRCIEGTGADGEDDHAHLIGRLSALQDGDAGATAPPDAPAPAVALPAVALPAVAAPAVVPGRKRRKAAGAAAPPVAGPPAHPEPRPGVSALGDVLVDLGVAQADQVALALAAQGLGDARLLGEILLEDGIVPADALAEALAVHAVAGQIDAHTALSDSNIRVDVGLLDRLMTLVGELVLSRNNIVRHMDGASDPAVTAASQRLDLVTSELQEAVLKTRMQPIRTVWARFPRVVRDLSRTCGKDVRLETDGDDTELDRTIIEAIKDPLTHVIRNAVDHGVEAPGDRVARGKPAQGVLHLRARHEGGQVIIEIADDGAGIDATRVRAKAVSRGLLTEEQAAALPDREARQLIFVPGFSTAETVTNVSGRGVGMDVVKTNIEKIGGTVDVQSERGAGTTIRVKIPLTLAIVPALVVLCDGDRYAIPQLDVVELVWLDGERAGGVEMLHDVPVHRLRGNLLPLVSLRRALGLPDSGIGHDSGLGDDSGIGHESVTIVVLSADDRQFGLVVDGVVTTEEIVVKPLGRLLQGMPTYSGATIMGDGRVALILDAVQLAQHAGLVTAVRNGLRAERPGRPDRGAVDRAELLVVACGDDGRVALPLHEVARLEEIRRDAVEFSDNQPVVRYRNGILPLVELGPLIGRSGSAGDGEHLTVVVHHAGQREVGLVVDRIVDIVPVALSAEDLARGGTLVVQDRVTDLIHVTSLLGDALGWRDERQEALAR